MLIIIALLLLVGCFLFGFWVHGGSLETRRAEPVKIPSQAGRVWISHHILYNGKPFCQCYGEIIAKHHKTLVQYPSVPMSCGHTSFESAMRQVNMLKLLEPEASIAVLPGYCSAFIDEDYAGQRNLT